MTTKDGPDWIPIYLVGLILAAFLAAIAGTGAGDGRAVGVAGSAPVVPTTSATAPLTPTPPATPAAPIPTVPTVPGPGSIPTGGAGTVARLPNGGTRVFADNGFLVAYYGTAGTGALGVLGEASPERIMPRLRAAAAKFARGGRRVQPVFELIVTVAHREPSPTGKYSTDIDRRLVARYIRAAHRYRVLLVLDLQPGTAGFLPVAKRWEWALRDPWVGLALDPEWRMSLGGVPGRRIGSVDAVEVNRVSRWLDGLTRRERLPEKVFLLHQFRVDMIRRIERVKARPHLAEVQHVDGFGTPSEKMATFRRVIRPRQFRLGLKLFYDEDVPRMRPAQALALRPRVRFVSYQ